MIRKLAAAVAAVVAIAGCASGVPMVHAGHGLFRTAQAPVVGEVLSTTNGSWTNKPTSFAYQWQRCSSGCVNIAGATASTYTIQTADVGDTLDVVVTATNAGGSASQTSTPTGVVTAGSSSGLPSGATLQAIDGGATYFASHGFSATANPPSPILGFDNPHQFPISVFDQAPNSTSLALYHSLGINGIVQTSPSTSLYSAMQADGMWAMDKGPGLAVSPSPLIAYWWQDEDDGANGANQCPSSSTQTWFKDSPACTTDPISPANAAGIISDFHGAHGGGDPTRAVYENFTGGNTVWSGPNSGSAKAFMNEGDINSFDTYIMTGAYTPGGSNDHNSFQQYNDVLTARQTVNYAMPTWFYVEAGDPESGGGWSGISPTPAQESAEAWAGIIGGARGLQWFDHSFNGSDPGYNSSSSLLVNCGSCNATYTSGTVSSDLLDQYVGNTDSHITSLAPQLNDPFVNGYVTAQTNPHPYNCSCGGIVGFGQSADTMVKYDAASNKFYLFVAPAFNGAESVTFTVRTNGSPPSTITPYRLVDGGSNGSGASGSPIAVTNNGNGTASFTLSFTDGTDVQYVTIPNS